MPSTWTYVTKFPDCDLCAQRGVYRQARYDGKTVFGPWANMCDADFEQFGTGLGIGKGQRLLIQGEEDAP